MDEDIRHSLRDELEGLHIILIFVELLHVVLQINLGFSGLFLHLVEQESYVLTGSFLDIGGDVNVGDGGPGQEEVVEEFHEVFLIDFIGVFGGDEFERNTRFVFVGSALQYFHVFDEIFERDLQLNSNVLCCHCQYRKR